MALGVETWSWTLQKICDSSQSVAKFDAVNSFADHLKYESWVWLISTSNAQELGEIVFGFGDEQPFRLVHNYGVRRLGFGTEPYSINISSIVSCEPIFIGLTVIEPGRINQGERSGERLVGQWLNSGNPNKTERRSDMCDVPHLYDVGVSSVFSKLRSWLYPSEPI